MAANPTGKMRKLAAAEGWPLLDDRSLGPSSEGEGEDEDREESEESRALLAGFADLFGDLQKPLAEGAQERAEGADDDDVEERSIGGGMPEMHCDYDSGLGLAKTVERMIVRAVPVLLTSAAGSKL